MKEIGRILTLRNWRVFRGNVAARKMEGVDLYGDLEDPFFFGDQPSLSPDQVNRSTSTLRAHILSS